MTPQEELDLRVGSQESHAGQPLAPAQTFRSVLHLRQLLRIGNRSS